MRVYVECHTDYYLFKKISSSLEGISVEVIHIPGKGDVINRVRDDEVSSVGIVDEDPGSAQHNDLLNNYTLIKDLSTYRIYQRNEDANRKYLVLICPKLEDWLITLADEEDIKLEDYGLIPNPNYLHKMNPLKKRHSDYRSLIDSLIGRSKTIQSLKNELTALINE